MRWLFGQEEGGSNVSGYLVCALRGSALAHPLDPIWRYLIWQAGG